MFGWAGSDVIGGMNSPQTVLSPFSFKQPVYKTHLLFHTPFLSKCAINGKLQEKD